MGFDKIIGVLPARVVESASGAQKAVIPAVTFADAPALLANGTPHRLLDVRKATEFSTSHLRDAQNLAHTRLRPRLNDVAAGCQLLVHCASGLRAAGACAFLSRAGRETICIADKFDNAPKQLLA
jgi:hydroxyacylglutathione hydrolase